MKTKMKNAWKWVAEHKVEVGLTVLTFVGGIVVCKSINHTKSTIESIKAVSEFFDTVDAEKKKPLLPDIGIGTMELYEPVDGGKGMEMMLDNLSLDKLGELGEKIRANIPDHIPENAVVWTLLSIRPGEEET